MRSLLLGVLVAAAPVAAQTTPPADTQPRKPLNLRLDDAMRSQPTITFGPGQAAKEEQSVLPALGSDARRIEPTTTRSQSSSSPFPKDTETGPR